MTNSGGANGEPLVGPRAHERPPASSPSSRAIILNDGSELGYDVFFLSSSILKGI